MQRHRALARHDAAAHDGLFTRLLIREARYLTRHRWAAALFWLILAVCFSVAIVTQRGYSAHVVAIAIAVAAGFAYGVYQLRRALRLWHAGKLQTRDSHVIAKHAIFVGALSTVLNATVPNSATWLPLYGLGIGFSVVQLFATLRWGVLATVDAGSPSGSEQPDRA